MPNNNDVLIQVGVDIPSSVREITEELKNKVAPQVNEQKPLKIVGGLNLADTQKKIQAQLATINKNLSVDLNLTTNDVSGKMQKVSNSVKESLNSVKNSAMSANASLMQLDTTLDEPIKIVFDTDGTMNLERTLANARKVFEKYGGTTFDWSKGDNGEAERFVAEIKAGSGEIQRLTYALSENNKEFNYVGGKGSDKGIYKLEESIRKAKSEYTSLLAEFKSSNSGIESGLSNEINAVNNAIDGLGNTTSIEELKTAFNTLKATASDIKKNLDTTSSSFNKVTNAENTLRTMETTLQTLNNDFSTLKTKPEEVVKSISNLKGMLEEVDRVEKESGRNVEWSEKYRSLVIAVKEAQTSVKFLQQSEKSDNSQAQNQLKYYQKLRSENELLFKYQKQRINAGEEEAKNLDRLIKNTKGRIDNAEKQIVKQKLYNQELEKSINEQKNLNDAQLDNLTKRQTDRNSQVGINVDTALTNLSTLEQKWEKEGILVGNFKAKVESLKSVFSGVTTSADFTKANKQMRNLSAQAKNLESNLKQVKSAATLDQDKNIFSNRISAYMETNSKAAKKYRDEFTRIKEEMKGVTDVDGFKRVQKEFTNLQLLIKSNGDATKTWGDRIKESVKKFSEWMTLTTIIAGAFRGIRTMFNDVVELDTALIDLKKTFKGTTEDLQKFYYSANDTAKELGVTTSEVINAASSWSRLGYNGAEAATQMAKVSSILSSISTDIDIDMADSTLISVMKAFGIEADDALDGIASKINVIGNNFALSNGDIATALQKSSAAMAAANTDFEHTVALITAAQEIVQDSDVVGKMCADQKNSYIG